MNRPLSPAEMYPAGVADVTSRTLRLSSGVSIRVAERGPVDGTPIVFIHGWGASQYMFRHALDLLPSRGFRVTVPDLRGLGLSEKPAARGSYTADALCADLSALLDALGLQHTALVGQSMGGGLALEFALRSPRRITALGLINPTGLTRISYLALLRVVPREIVNVLGRAMVPRWAVAVILRRMAYADAAKVTERDIDEYWAPTQRPGFVRAARAMLSEFSWAPVSNERLEGFAVPSLAIIGKRDKLVRRSDATSRLPHARVHVLDGGHCVHEELPMETFEIIERFVRDTIG